MTRLLTLLRTLAGIGPRRLQRRLRYDIRQRLDRRLPSRLATAWAGGNGQTPRWCPVLRALESQDLLLPAVIEPQFVSFIFLHLEQELAWPISWNNPSWPRLWQFHLHYFDWAREWLELAIISGHWPDQAALLESLVDHWIAANPPGRGDGWHSYTLSLRTRNWVWLFRCCPELVTPYRLQSLWQQLLWLQAHPEHCHGGNHWLENLTALAIGGLQFEGVKAHAMHQRAMRLLQQELTDQLLGDGGHQERSASYHLLMLDRLIELAELLQLSRDERPKWLQQAVHAMANWATAIRLESGGFPRFNDSASDACRALDLVLVSARSYLEARAPCELQLRCWSPQELTDLPETGWSLLRPGQGWELAFKCGVPCPPHLGAHAHSDLLSFDLWRHGQPVIAEVGTSVYGSGSDRQFERSSAAHNSLQLGLAPPGSHEGNRSDDVIWIEPVDVWAGFRVGRKAQPHSRSLGRSGPWLWVAGSHTGFCSIAAQHFRWLALRLSAANQPVLVVVDAISAGQPLYWRSWWHLGPDSSPSLAELGLSWRSWSAPVAVKLQPAAGYIAIGFGQRQPRSTLQRGGFLPAGRHLLISVLAPHSIHIDRHISSSMDGELMMSDLGSIQWRWPDTRDHLSSLLIPQVWIDP